MKENPEVKHAMEEPKMTKVEDESIKEVEDLKKVEEAKATTAPKYENVFAKYMMGKPLSSQDETVMKEVNNEYTHQTDNQQVMVPDTTLSGIFGLVAEQHPLYGDVNKINVHGGITIKKHKAIKAGDAAFVKEGVEAVDEENEFVDVK